jgi:molybdopterin/thiamine biosynthesis adenylyltransferase
MSNLIEGKRWSGFDWADQQKQIMMIGAGGIGSWTCLSLSRIMHEIIIIDGDMVDQTNVQGGQMYRTKDVGTTKVSAVVNICREFGCVNEIMSIPEMYSEPIGMADICITGLDNMAARKQIFEEWERHVASVKEVTDDRKFLFIDGRMAGELCEVFIVDGDKPEQLEEYKTWLFDDAEIEDLDCTMKQTTFVAMSIAAFITSSLCNWLANNKLGMEFKEVPFHQRFYAPMLEFKTESVEQIKQNKHETNIA